MRRTVAAATIPASSPLLVAAALSAGVFAQMGVRSTAPPGPRNGMIVGQVVDAGTGSGVGEAIVQLVLQGYAEDAPGSPNSRVMADADGRFFFTELPAGRYYLQATKDGYVRGAIGQRQPHGQTQSLTLGERERNASVELRLWKYAVIGGTVVDEAGEPVVGITVRALVREVFAGRTRFGNMQVNPELVPVAVTDDRGMFRLSRLWPGTYVVVVPSNHTTVPAASLASPGGALRTTLFWGGVQEMSALGTPRTVQMGDFALMSHNRVLIPPPPTPEGRMQVYGTTFYPAATTADEATPVIVRSGDERTDLTIGLRPVPAVRVSGRLVTPDGSVPPPTMLRLDGAATLNTIGFGSPTEPDYVGLEAATGLSDAQGRFALLGVAPGEYVLRQGNRFLERPIREGKPSYWIAQAVAVGKEDVEDLVVALRPALRVEGRLEFRAAGGEAPPPPPLLGVEFGTPFGDPGRFFATIDREALSFATVAGGGRYVVRPYESAGWVVQSVTLDGKDVTDRTFDLQSDATSFVITFSDRPSKVSGTVTGDDGRPSGSAVVLAFATDRQRWSGYGDSSRYLRSALTTDAGTYTFDHLPPGEYHAIAVGGSELDGWRDPQRLEALAAQATRLSIGAGGTLTTLDLRVRPVR